MDVDSFDFLKRLPQEQYTNHKGKPIQVRELIKLIYPERFEETLPKYLTMNKKKTNKRK
jgi:hypothetical protein